MLISYIGSVWPIDDDIRCGVLLGSGDVVVHHHDDVLVGNPVRVDNLENSVWKTGLQCCPLYNLYICTLNAAQIYVLLRLYHTHRHPALKLPRGCAQLEVCDKFNCETFCAKAF